MTGQMSYPKIVTQVSNFLIYKSLYVEGCGCGGGSLSSAANELGGVRHKRHRGAMAEAPERENHTSSQRQNASPRTYSPQTGDARRHRRPSILGRGQQNSTRPQARHNQTTSHVTTPTTATTSTSTSTKTNSFHTLEELDANTKPKPKPETVKPETAKPAAVVNVNVARGSKLKDNVFLVRDRLEREKDEKESTFERLRRDPLSALPEKCPPGGGARRAGDAPRGVRRARRVAARGFSPGGEGAGGRGGGSAAGVREGEVRGGLEELVELNETGRLGRILRATRVERGIGRQTCGGCGGARFVPCLECGGSCKVLVNGVDKQKCPNCNENGLVHCPSCI
ncbi:hypothetical protein ACSQ67_005041 [Phaseolus vulgaris]